MSQNSTSPEATTNGGSVIKRPEFVYKPARGPVKIEDDWTYVQPTREHLDIMRGVKTIAVHDDAYAELEKERTSKLHPKTRVSKRYLSALERAGQFMAVELSARGISVGTFETLMVLGESVRVAGEIAAGTLKDANGNVVTVTVEDRVKAAAAVAVGAKNYGELSDTVIRQLAPEKAEKPVERKPTAPSLDAPMMPVQVNDGGTVIINQPVTHGTQQDTRDGDSGGG